MSDSKIETEFLKAHENAESILNRELTHNEEMVLTLGYQYGKRQGQIEGVDRFAKKIKTTLNKINS